MENSLLSRLTLSNGKGNDQTVTRKIFLGRCTFRNIVVVEATNTNLKSRLISCMKMHSQ